MPVRKFRTFDEAEEALWRAPGDSASLRIAASLRRFARHFVKGRFPPGVHKYRSIEDANRAREQWEEEATRRA